MSQSRLSRDERPANPNPLHIMLVIVALVLTIAGSLSAFKLFENVDADEVVVIQSPISGKLTWHSTPGIKWQGFGYVTAYPKRAHFWFSSKEGQGTDAEDAIRVLFNDGASADISGSLSWEMPLDEDNLRGLHTRYGSPRAIEQQLIRTVVEKSVYMTGPLMTSAESYASRRNDLLRLIDDQIKYGTYATRSRDERTTDPITGHTKTVRVVELVESERPQDFGYRREAESPLGDFGIRIFNLSLNEVSYDGNVLSQIRQQQEAIMEVQTAIATAKKAEQEAITAEQKGKAAAAEAKWKQEVLKAQAVTEAEQRRDVAKLDLDTADLRKQEQILLGEGEARRRELVMSADGALDKKLEAYLEVNRMFADAIRGYQGAWVPSVVMGGNGGFNQAVGGGALDFINLLTVKAARDLALDLEVSGNNN